MVSNTPGVLTDETAELAFTLMLSVSRRIVEGDRMVREGRTPPNLVNPEVLTGMNPKASFGN